MANEQIEFVEAEPEGAPAAPAAPVAPDKLERFRKEGALDEAAIAAEIEFAQQARLALDNESQLMSSDKTLRREYLEALNRKGPLPQNLKTELDWIKSQTIQPTPPPPPAPKITQAELKTKYRELLADGREDEAFDFAIKSKIEPEIENLKAEVATVRTENKAAQQQARLIAQQSAAANEQDKQLRALARQFPDYVEETQDGTVVFKDDKFKAALIEEVKEHLPDTPLVRLGAKAEFRMGKVVRKTPQGRPAFHSSAAPAGKPPERVPKPGEWLMEVPVIDEGQG